MLFKSYSNITFKWQSGFSGEINTTPRRNLQSKVINNIRSCHYSRAQENTTVLRMWDSFLPPVLMQGARRNGPSVRLWGGIERRNGCWCPGVLWDPRPCTASHLPNTSTCCRQLLLVLGSVPELQERQGTATGNQGHCLRGTVPGGCYWPVLFSALLDHHRLMGITNYWILG